MFHEALVNMEGRGTNAGWNPCGAMRRRDDVINIDRSSKQELDTKDDTLAELRMLTL